MQDGVLSQNEGWSDDFNQTLRSFDWKPARSRTCTNLCGIFLVFVPVVATLSVLLYRSLPSSNFDNDALAQLFPHLQGLPVQVGASYKIIYIMTSLSLVLSIVFVLLLKCLPECMVYFVIYLGLATALAIAIYYFYLGAFLYGIVFTVLTTLMFWVLYCFKHHIDTAIALVRLSAYFLTSAPETFVLPVITTIVTILFSYLTLKSFSGFLVLYQTGQITTQYLEGSLTIWLLVYLFVVNMFFYIMVFLIAWNAAEWHYKCTDESIWHSFVVLLRYHLGSISIAAALLAIVTFLRYMIQAARSQQDSDNFVGRCCLCMLDCCLAQIQYYTKILNRNAIIFTALTGDDYLDAARNGGSLLFNNFDAFYVVDLIVGFLLLTELVICVGVPTLIAGVGATYSDLPDQHIAYVVVVVFMMSLLISIVFLSTFNESICSLFLFECFDKKLSETGRHRPTEQQVDEREYMQTIFSSVFRKRQQNSNEGTELNQLVMPLQHYDLQYSTTNRVYPSNNPPISNPFATTSNSQFLPTNPYANNNNRNAW